MAPVSLGLITPPSITGWYISQETALDVEEGLAYLATLGWAGDTSDRMQPNSTSLMWTVTLSKPGYTNLIGSEGQWIVCDGINVSIVSAAQLVALYTANVALTWVPTTTAPVASARSGQQATLSFPQPSSPNGPWTYAVTQTDTTSGPTTQAATLVGNPSVDVNGNVTLMVEDLVAGHVYTFVVTITATNYAGVSATSVATVAVTATA